MDCPRCKTPMRTIHTFRVNGSSTTHRMQCEKCLLIATSVTAIVNIDPDHGEGARALSKKLSKNVGIITQLQKVLQPIVKLKS